MRSPLYLAAFITTCVAYPLSPESTNTTTSKFELSFGRTVVPVPNLNKPPKLNKYQFEYAEHAFIGDTITLGHPNGSRIAASDYTFTLNSGVVVTYGQINALAGDFYGTDSPISDGSDDGDRANRFLEAFATLAEDRSRQPDEANKIIQVLAREVQAVNDALAQGQDPSVAYSTLPSVNVELQLITLTRPSGVPSYLGLASINWDHFGDDARTTYNTGHASAIQKAISGDLDGAYAMNAFADHFLEDLFSAGHLRTPRRYLHGRFNKFYDLLAKFMHDEDCAIGLTVQNVVGESWSAYGDKRALDAVDQDNLKRCVAAVQASADEIYTAYQTQQAPPPSDYGAWKYTPTLDSARGQQVLAPLFTFAGERRADITDRRTWTFTTDWWAATTVALIESSGLWNYPITL